MLHRISILWLLAVLALLTFVASAKGDSSPGVLKAEQGAQLEHETPLQFAPALPGADLTASECPPYASAVTPATHGIVYDGGWILRPFVPQQSPFELKVSLQNQFRHTGFANEEAQVVNSAGNIVPTPPLNAFDINRGRLILSGYAWDPSLEFYTNFDYNTVSENQFQVLMAWIRKSFSPGLRVSYGIGKVPGTWEWLEAAQATLGAERSLATTFFRPSMTAGVWVDGEPLTGVHYHALVGNGFNTFSLRSSELDTNFVYSGMLWWEPFGEFGAGFSDFELHSEAVVRVGNAFTYNRAADDPNGSPGPEQTAIRLSDGTPLVETGALAPGVTLQRFDLSLYTVHAGWKYAGLSLSGEYFWRWLTHLQADGPILDNAIFDHGFFVQAAAFLRPQSLELFARGAAVFGPFGNGSEVGAGLNLYLFQQRYQRFTFDVAHVEDSPAQQDRTGFMAGASGVLFRTQFWLSF